VRIRFPVNSRDVSKRVEPKHLVPWVPRASWDGWFGIGIFPPGAPLRWVKAHFFHRACAPGKHPLAAVEGLDAESELALVWATPDEVVQLRGETGSERPVSSPSPFRVSMEDRFLLEGAAPRYSLAVKLAEHQAEARFAFETGWPIWWSRWGRLLAYAGQHAAAHLSLTHLGREQSLQGFGVLEHVCGISLPFDFTRRLPLHYHWDVLAFHTPGSPFDSAAGLSLGRQGQTLFPLRAAARLPGRSAEAMQGLVVRYLETSRTEGPAGEARMLPLRWEGTLRSRAGTFRYWAAAATPVVGNIPGGGMLGFDFEGEWSRPGSGTRRWQGTGFTEYGDFSGRLVNLAGAR